MTSTCIFFFVSTKFWDLVITIGVRISKTHELELYGQSMQSVIINTLYFSSVNS